MHMQTPSCQNEKQPFLLDFNVWKLEEETQTEKCRKSINITRLLNKYHIILEEGNKTLQYLPEYSTKAI